MPLMYRRLIYRNRIAAFVQTALAFPETRLGSLIGVFVTQRRDALLDSVLIPRHACRPACLPCTVLFAECELYQGEHSLSVCL